MVNRGTKIFVYLRENTLEGLKRKPEFKPKILIVTFVLYVISSVSYGLLSGLLELKIIKSSFTPILPFTLFVFPSFLEEVFFRGVVIPYKIKESNNFIIILYISLSTILFVAWHPLNALTINPHALNLFLDVRFLIIAALLGITCSIAYIYSRSLWVSVIIHWLSVVIWVFLFGGRNLILD